MSAPDSGRHLEGVGFYGPPRICDFSFFSLLIVPLIKRETAKMSTALPLQEQYDTYVTLLQFEVDFKLYYDLITMMVFTLSHFVLFCCVTLVF